MEFKKCETKFSELDPNLEYIQSMSGGDKSFENSLIAIIKNEFETEKNEYYKNIAVKNLKHTVDNVHKLKHKVGILGLDYGYELTIAFELELLEGKTNLQEDFEGLIEVMTKFLDRL